MSLIAPPVNSSTSATSSSSSGSKSSTSSSSKPNGPDGKHYSIMTAPLESAKNAGAYVMKVLMSILKTILPWVFEARGKVGKAIVWETEVLSMQGASEHIKRIRKLQKEAEGLLFETEEVGHDVGKREASASGSAGGMTSDDRLNIKRARVVGVKDLERVEEIEVEINGLLAKVEAAESNLARGTANHPRAGDVFDNIAEQVSPLQREAHIHRLNLERFCEQSLDHKKTIDGTLAEFAKAPQLAQQP